ncbi:hypothetical protein [Dickeya fangzhongdai]|uniref:hypothetical protein n=1 Tax=Dickeya fangzhongdai TaxID=1778540 RepID=UPI0011AB60BD|nr:hypothetical protein [Dickeya fangzhongdai]WOY01105.1 hypothetical protein OGM22_04535 [Dickeya fangzhongdai]WOY03744.1 hypothetical protein OGM21_18115 [Dickeya fangzhongdai]GGC07344.1 hypothetical protein GCM10007171_25470 [Dickeya fangzhongdai]
MQLRRAQSKGMLLRFFVNFPSIRAAVCNGEYLKRRGRLNPDWDRALFHPGWGEVPMVGLKGTVYWFVGFDKEHLPVELQPLWKDAWLVLTLV